MAMASLSPQMQRLLARLPGWPGGAGARVEGLDGGLNNLTLRVRFAGHDLVVRQALPQGPALKLDGAAELRVLAAAAGIAPPLRVADAGAGITVSDYLPGARSWTAADFAVPGNLERLTERLQALHRLDHDLPTFDATATARSYLAAAGFPADLRAELLRLAGDFDAAQSGGALCHNDLVAANILDDGRLWLIDFEYAVASDPLLDLAGVAALNGLDRRQQDRLLAAYYGSADAVPGSFPRACRLVLLMALAWCYALQGWQPAAGRRALLGRLRGLLKLFPANGVAIHE
jgi:aminoglycoside phosphotransferase (APT) family kinase protein